MVQWEAGSEIYLGNADTRRYDLTRTTLKLQNADQRHLT